MNEPAYLLIETLRREADGTYLRLERHLARLARSARMLGFRGAERARDELAALEPTGQAARIRLTLSPDGRITVTAVPFIPDPADRVWRVAIARTRLSSTNRLLAHKTSLRASYDAARAEFPAEAVDEVLMLNERGDVCEGTITSLFVAEEDGGRLTTPPVSAGLLAGVLRAELIATRRARTAVIRPEALDGKTFFLGNSLRGLMPARLV